MLRKQTDEAQLHSDEQASAPAEAGWIERVSKKLRYGSRPTAEEIAALTGQPKGVVIDTFMQDRRFGLSLLAFNMSYLGRQVDHLVDPQSGHIHPEVLAQPLALASTKSALEGGDYFDLHTASPALYIQRMPSLHQDKSNEQAISDIRAVFDKVATTFANDRSMGCATANALVSDLKEGRWGWLPGSLSYNRRLAHLAQLIADNWLGSVANKYSGDCYLILASTADLADRAKKIAAAVENILRQVAAAVGPDTGNVLADLVKIDLTTFSDLPQLNPPLTEFGFWKRLPNSGSNMNRKRAAFVLKTFFCDDMTPVSLSGDDAVEAEPDAVACGAQPPDTTHVRAKHASAPMCAACHYKMDPIGALFRDHGIRGEKFGFKAPRHVFDDLTTYEKGTSDHTCYYNHPDWLDESGQLRTGYYAAPGQLASGWEGDNLEDLFRYLGKSAPVRKCVARKMTEFFLGSKQAYDGGWLIELAKEVSPKVPPTESSAAVKRLIKKLMLSNYLAERDPVANKCYDFASGAANSADGPPCEIAFLLEKHCATCHARSDADWIAEYGINLMEWKQQQGDSRAFTHQDQQGKQYSPRESYQRILRSLTDPGKEGDAGALIGPSGAVLELMPLDMQMPEVERQALVQWLNSQLAQQP